MSKFKRHKEQQINVDNVWQDDVFKILKQYADFLTNALTADTENFVLNVNGEFYDKNRLGYKKKLAGLRKKAHKT